ncbi:Xaa-Pro dipeptidase [Pleionea litopenaei]|uniref:Xaa-Pro dipeptidase n=1 Tax=Pleionea litopenaei TaxID=3070815 RepID=A0AA51X5U5_9GAMM|nr:Xaa-Pro dipeptidase [Pleionea sp. HL-JVS1]WMS86096.1 Xaa-Pro dipeptidase [Pleionea sp. HL-JVS1]
MAMIIETGYSQHIEALLKRYQQLLAEHNYDYLVIPSGMPIRKYLDDMDYPFKVNPHFKALLPLTDHPHCQIIIPQTGKPQLLYYQPVDFWHTVPADPSGAYTEFFEIQLIARPEQALPLIPKDGRVVLMGRKEGVLEAVSFSAQNPESLVYPLYWDRAYKSAYEVECIWQANRLAAKAHNAARDEFYRGGNEFSINNAYLVAANALENDMPYGNIVALNQNAAILHYTDCQRTTPNKHFSFLIDAGAEVNGYASDITRTYSYAKNDEFADLIQAMDEMHLNLLEQIKPQQSYVDLHVQAHHRIADILKRFDFVTASADALVESGVSSAFFPHGLGHQLGLQVHDVGGHQSEKAGGTTPPPQEHPFLRNTRTIEQHQVLTVEPGLYFIDSLLDDVKQTDLNDAINWEKINQFKVFGGIRIEDDILVTADGHRNLSREAFAEVE